jgi:hypothetical protein
MASAVAEAVDWNVRFVLFSPFFAFLVKDACFAFLFECLVIPPLILWFECSNTSPIFIMELVSWRIRFWFLGFLGGTRTDWTRVLFPWGGESMVGVSIFADCKEGVAKHR